MSPAKLGLKRKPLDAYVAVRLSADVRERLIRQCQEEGRSLSELLRQLIVSYLREVKRR